VIAFHGPGAPSNAISSDLARGFPEGVASCGSVT
jgi:hypothetical protein